MVVVSTLDAVEDLLDLGAAAAALQIHRDDQRLHRSAHKNAHIVARTNMIKPQSTTRTPACECECFSTT